jgi:hypothetical protein
MTLEYNLKKNKKKMKKKDQHEILNKWNEKQIGYTKEKNLLALMVACSDKISLLKVIALFFF